MRGVVLLLLLAGCAGQAAEPVGPDPTTALYRGSQAQQAYQLGPDANASADAKVVIAVCGVRENVFAYAFNATRLGLGGQHVDLHAAFVPETKNTTSFAIAAFTPGPDGLVPAATWMGGVEVPDPWNAYLLQTIWLDAMPSRLSVPIGADGMVRLVLACEGTGAINYIVGSGDVERPDYLEPVVASRFDAFYAVGTESIVLSFPPTTVPGFPGVWSIAGDITVSLATPLPAPPVVNMQHVNLEWRATGPGWSTVACRHQGWSDHGTWRYDGELHGDVRHADGLMADEIATLWLSQQLLGSIAVQHTHSGEGPAAFDFEVEHAASSPMGWATMCVGMHFGQSLDVLVGSKGAAMWMGPRSLVRPL